MMVGACGSLERHKKSMGGELQAILDYKQYFIIHVLYCHVLTTLQTSPACFNLVVLRVDTDRTLCS